MSKAEIGNKKESIVKNVIAILEENGERVNDGLVSSAADASGVENSILVDLVNRFTIFVNTPKPIKDKEKQIQILKHREDTPISKRVVEDGIKQYIDYIVIDDGTLVNVKDSQTAEMNMLAGAGHALNSIVKNIDKSGKEKIIEELKTLADGVTQSDRSTFLRDYLDTMIGKKEEPEKIKSEHSQNSSTDMPNMSVKHKALAIVQNTLKSGQSVASNSTPLSSTNSLGRKSPREPSNQTR